MLKNLLLLLLSLNFAKAQTFFTDSTIVKSKKNEVSLDILQLLWPKRINFTFERMLSKNTSISVNPIFFESWGYDNSRKWSLSNIETHSIQMRINFYTNPKKNHYGFAFFPSLKYSTSFEDYPIISGYRNNKISDLYIGNGIQWKYIFRDKLGFNLGADIHMAIYSKKYRNWNIMYGNHLNLNTNFNYRF
jgi:hypothetical protein